MSLYNLAMSYLNQKLPDISGIFSLPQASSVTTPVVQQPVTAPGLTPEQLRLLYGQRSDDDDRDDGFRGGGKFGNLDLTRSKTFTKDVYDEELGDFIPTELTAYYNPTLGNFQTFEGKNINPMFSNTGLTFGFGGGVLEMLGLKPKTVGGYIPGSIRGFYDSPIDLIKRNKNEQERTTKQIAASKKADVAKADMLRAIRDTGGGNGGDNNPGGGGFDREDRGPGASSRGGTSATSSGLGNLGFSDIRLKENVELIGKSPSNINIYKFNYKDNSTTYQGVMAHEVPWANVKHSNGYMMVDYDKVDVEFKKWLR